MFSLALVRWLLGWVEFRIFPKRKGNCERFLNLTARMGAGLWKIRRSDEYFSAAVNARRYAELWPCAKKAGVRLRAGKRGGLPFLINRVTARKGMVAGAVAFFLILHVFSLYVWSVEVSGCKEIAQEQVIGAARELGLAPGSLKSRVDAEALQQQLMLKFPDVAWLSVNTRGSDVVIVLEEKKKNPEIVTENKVANIKAAESGQILRMEVYRGQAQVKVGDAVVKGQLLISGIVENADGNSQMVRASGRIVAATERSFTARVPLKQTVETDEGRRVVRRSIRVFGVELPLTLTAAPKGNFKREYRRENVRGVTGVLPVSLFTETWTERTTKEVALTEQQAREQAERNLSEMLKSLSDTTILSSEKKGEVKDGAYVLTFTCKCEQNIAVESEILFK